MKKRRRDKAGRHRGAPTTQPNRPLRLATWAGMLVALAVGVLTRRQYFPYCIHDDAFISFRYARNLARGDGFVMNPGERVEGITNFLWTLGSTPAFLAGLDPGVVTRLLGAACSLLLVFGVFLFSDLRLGGSWFVLVAPLLLLGNLAFAMESLSGLETLAFAVVVFLAYVAFVEERRSGRWPFLWVAVCGAAATLRPEGVLVFAVLWSWELLRGIQAREPRATWARRAAWRLGLFVALVAPLFVFRLVYYGSWLPNTFYTKVGYTAAQLSRGWRYTSTVLLFSMTWPLLLVAAGAGVTAWLRPRTPRQDAMGVAFALVIAYVAYIWAAGGDYEPTARFYMPVLAFVYLLFQEGLRGAVSLLAARAQGWRVAAGLAALTAFLWIGFRSEQRVTLLLKARGWPMARFNHHQELRQVGEWFAQRTPPGTRIALSSVGALPFYADRPILDMMGLTEPAIGRLKIPNMGFGPPGHEKGDAAYVLSRQPDIVLFDRGHLFQKEATQEEVLAGARGLSELGLAQSRQFLERYELQRVRMGAGILHFFRLRHQPAAP